MLIEIRKAGFINKGAELMLYATLKKMKEAYPKANFVMAPSADNGSAPYFKRAELGFLQKAWFSCLGLQFGDLAAFAPKKLREAYGVILDKDINIVIDAAGFSYSDQWGVKSTSELAKSCKRWKKQERKVILLPQAFGPFNSPKIQDYIKIAVDNLDLAFARDPVSYQHLTQVVGERSTIRIAPDFTNILEGIVPQYFDAENHRLCFVPNYRMIDKTPRDQSEAYLPFMIKCAQYCLKKNLKPFILIHEGPNDLMLAQHISDGVGGNLPIIQESHPLKIKGILGACQGTIGSRFHGLVSALSQGVPSLATGWSHKYKMLFHDYSFDDGLLDVMADDEEIFKKIDMITEGDSKEEIISRITVKSEELKKLTNDMWETVFNVLN